MKYLISVYYQKVRIGFLIAQEYLAAANIGTSSTTRARTNAIAKTMRYGGRVCIVSAAGMSVYNIATSDNKIRTTVVEAGGWTGAWAGAKGGAAIGGTIGPVFPGPGNAIGVFVGGGFGYWAGSGIAENTYDEF